jgi:Dual-action HEIGH metallo-peptidase
MITKETVFAVMCSALAFGCSTGQPPAEERQEIIDNLIQAGFQADAITVADGKVYLGEDIHVTLEASREMLEPAGPGPEHYRTSNLVSGKTLICINPTATFSSYAALMGGLDLAIGNYNALPLVFDFRRGPSTTCNANITISTMSGTGGSSGFPSGGNPYSSISIGTGLVSYGAGVIKHVITHEIGHTIGMCHTDGGGTGGGAGCIFIPGTPTTDSSSIFNSMFRSASTGNFSSGDITALTVLY